MHGVDIQHSGGAHKQAFLTAGGAHLYLLRHEDTVDVHGGERGVARRRSDKTERRREL